MTWPRPLPESLQSLNPVMAYITGVILVIAAAFALAKRYITIASIVIAGLILLVLASRYLYNHWRDYINSFKSLVFESGVLLACAAGYKATGNKNIICFSRNMLYDLWNSNIGCRI